MRRLPVIVCIAFAACLCASLAVPTGAQQTAQQLLPAGKERVLTELEARRTAAERLDALQYTGWEADRLRLGKDVPVTGTRVPAMEQFEKQFINLLRMAVVPGATVAIAYKGKLVYARGFGYADVSARTAMPPDALFRIASVSKAFTSVGTLKLCDQAVIRLDSKPVPKLNLTFTGNNRPDEHLSDITVKQLLQSTGGWDREISGDPMFVPLVREAANAYSNTLRPTRDSVLLYWLRRNLDFLPGTHFAYSNFGYAILGRYIEQVTGKPYEQYIKQDVLEPMGITRPRLGKTMELAAGETTYYAFPGQETAISVFPNVKGHIALPYGGDFSLEAMQADTGWIASTIDLVRFFSSLCGDGPAPRPISARTFGEMTAKPDVPEWKNKHLYFGMGIEVDESKGRDKLEVSRQGSLAGCMAYVTHLPDGLTFAFASNTRPNLAMAFQDQIITLIRSTLSKPIAWGDSDQFALYK